MAEYRNLGEHYCDYGIAVKQSQSFQFHTIRSMHNIYYTTKLTLVLSRTEEFHSATLRNSRVNSWRQINERERFITEASLANAIYDSTKDITAIYWGIFLNY